MQVLLPFLLSGYLLAPPVVQTVHMQDVGVHRITAYSCYDDLCLAADGDRASQGSIGVPLKGPAAYPLGTRLMIDGMLNVYTVRDRCPGCSGLWVDVWQENSKAEIEWGSQQRRMWRIE